MRLKMETERRLKRALKTLLSLHCKEPEDSGAYRWM
jgi:hypothetical protein